MSIENIPTPQDFYKKAEKIFFEGLISLFSKIFIQEKYPLKTLLNDDQEKIIENLHKSSEFYLRGKICEISPFLLIKFDKNYIIGEDKKQFSDFFTMDAKDLTGFVKILYGNDVFSNIYGSNFINIYEKNRKLRNLSTHSISSPSLDFNDILEDYLHTFSSLMQKSSFSKKLFFYMNYFSKKAKEYKHDYSSIQKYQSHFYAINYIFNKTEKSKIFFKISEQFKKNNRSHYCYKCHIRISDSKRNNPESISVFKFIHMPLEKSDILKFKTFIPVTKSSLNCKCFVCGYSNIVIEKYCKVCFLHGDRYKQKFLNDYCLGCFTNKNDIRRIHYILKYIPIFDTQSKESIINLKNVKNGIKYYNQKDKLKIIVDIQKRSESYINKNILLYDNILSHILSLSLGYSLFASMNAHKSDYVYEDLVIKTPHDKKNFFTSHFERFSLQETLLFSIENIENVIKNNLQKKLLKNNRILKKACNKIKYRLLPIVFKSIHDYFEDGKEIDYLSLNKKIKNNNHKIFYITEFKKYMDIINKEKNCG